MASLSAPPRTTSTIEDYLVTIYRLSAGGETVIGARLADQLGVTPATVTEMLTRLRANGLLSEGRPVELTPAGLRLARTLVSRHRLVERFLVDVLGFGWDEVHEEAHRLEHALSPRVAERLADFLGNPTTCPHGHPIMVDGGEEPHVDLHALTVLGKGRAGVVRRIANEETELLVLLSSLGIGLGAEVRVERTDPYGGPLHISVDGTSRVIGAQAAQEVLVEAR